MKPEVLSEKELANQYSNLFKEWKKDWNKFAYDVLKAELDPQQREILTAVQNNKMVSVCSGTARGKDFVAAVAALCFMYLTPEFVGDDLVGNTKVALTAPTDRQIGNIIYPEILRLFDRAKILHGRTVYYDIRTDYAEWFLTGFKADERKHEAWSGFHAVNTMFVVTEASGIADGTFAAIEGNLQGNSKLLLVFNPNTTIGYAAKSQFSSRFVKYRLDDLNAPNVLEKRIVINGQVDYEWVKDKVEAWCEVIPKDEFNEGLGDFEWEGIMYRPNDLFRIKVRGMFPKEAEDVLVPPLWIEIAQERWKKKKSEAEKIRKTEKLRLGVDVAGMGRDGNSFAYRYGDWLDMVEYNNSAGQADHMKTAGKVHQVMRVNYGSMAFIDTIGEGAGVYSRLRELGMVNAISCKYSESAEGRKDITGQLEFLNMKAYLYWCIRDWLNPANNFEACLPPDDGLAQELAETRYEFSSMGKIKVEDKEAIRQRLGRSPDKADALANTFYPKFFRENKNVGGYFKM
jgi:hypothetical protein